MKAFEDLLEDENVVVVNYKSPAERLIDQLETRSKVMKDKELLKLSRSEIRYKQLLYHLHSSLKEYGCATFDKEIFVNVYKQWLSCYLACIGKSLKKEYVSEELQDTYHTFRVEIEKE